MSSADQQQPTDHRSTDQWMAAAACRGASPADFFTPLTAELRATRRRRERRAKAVCALCVVRERCLEYALRRNERHGIWGGLTWPERQRLLGVDRPAEDR